MLCYIILYDIILYHILLYHKIFLHWKSSQALEQAAQGLTIPGVVQKTCRYGTSGHGLAGMVVMVGLDNLRGLFQP